MALRILSLYTLLVLFCISIFSQEECATEHLHKKLIKENSSYKSSFFRKTLQSSVDSGQVITIPVVVHVIHLGEAEGFGSNINYNQIYNAIETMNKNFQYAHGNDIGIQFCLAKRDPNGFPTNGVVRVDGRSIPLYPYKGIESPIGMGADETAVKDLSRWPNTTYYNIWVVHKIEGAAGYAYYPTTYINDGTTIRASSMSSISSTLSHELGHAFNLRHTFEGDSDGTFCPDNTNCSLDGDRVCDTPPHKRQDCFGQNNCGYYDLPYANSMFNYMSYCILRNRFTEGQKERMREAALSYPRNLLAQSNVCRSFDNFDISLDSILYPTSIQVNNTCSNHIDIEIIVSNKGLKTAKSINLAYKYKNERWVSERFSLNLKSFEKDTLKLKGLTLEEGTDAHNISFSVQTINGHPDQNQNNDSISISFNTNDTCIISPISEGFLSKISIFPSLNSNGIIHIKNMPLRTDKTIFEIFDVAGNIKESKTGVLNRNTTYDISHLANGAYFFRISVGVYSKTLRFYVIK